MAQACKSRRVSYTTCLSCSDKDEVDMLTLAPHSPWGIKAEEIVQPFTGCRIWEKRPRNSPGQHSSADPAGVGSVECGGEDKPFLRQCCENGRCGGEE